MTSISSPQTFSDLYNDLLVRVRASGSAASIVVAKRYINSALLDMHLGSSEKLPWAERRGMIITRAPYTTGTVSILRGQQLLVGSGDNWDGLDVFSITNARIGGKVIFPGSIDVYEINGMSAGFLNLSSKYIGTDLTDSTYTYFEDEYPLASDFLRPVNLRSFSLNDEVELISRSEFRRRYPRNSIPGQVQIACLNDFPPAGNTTPLRKVQFHRPPSTIVNIPYAYITSLLATTSAGVAQETLINDSDEPIVPRRGRLALVHHAAAQWYRDLKDDTRSAQAMGDYTTMMLRIIGDSEIGENRPQLRPRMAPYISRAKRPWRGSGKRFDINGKFDRME